MSETAELLEQKRRQLQALRQSRPSANCAKGHSSEADVRREMEVEDLEEEIRQLEKKLSERP